TAAAIFRGEHPVPFRACSLTGLTAWRSVPGGGARGLALAERAVVGGALARVGQHVVRGAHVLGELVVPTCIGVQSPHLSAEGSGDLRSRGVLVHPLDLVVGDRHACSPARLRPFSPPVGAPILSRVVQTSSSSASVSTSMHLAMLSASLPLGTVATSTACHIRHTIVQPGRVPGDVCPRRSSISSSSRSRIASRSPAATALETAGIPDLSTAGGFHQYSGRNVTTAGHLYPLRPVQIVHGARNQIESWCRWRMGPKTGCAQGPGK